MLNQYSCFLEYSSINIISLPKKYHPTAISTRPNPPRIALSPTFGKSLDIKAPAIQRAMPPPSIVDVKEPLIFTDIGVPFNVSPRNKKVNHYLSHLWNFLGGRDKSFNNVDVCSNGHPRSIGLTNLWKGIKPRGCPPFQWGWQG